MSGPGLRFRKLDLHVHTPASYDFDDKNVTAAQIVDRAIAAGLDAIAITDHNSGKWIDQVQEAASKKSLVVFPGVEISCHGGKSGIHLIALFDVDKDSNHVENLLSKLGIPPDKQGDIEALTDSNLGITAIVDIIQDSTWQGVAVPAHVTSAKGILEDIRGNPRTKVIQHPTLIAVEATCFQKEDKKKRAVNLLDGNDPTYRRKLAVYQASDNPSDTKSGQHSLAGIGSRCAYFKMEIVNLDSLRQCFLDSDVRIIQDFEFKMGQYPRIEKVYISGGFLKDQTIGFNEGLNSIIGGKGTGKSLLVELMRFVLEQEPAVDEIRQDHDRKLENRLRQGSFVELDFIDSAGKAKRLKRVYDPSEIQNDNSQYDLAQLYPVLFLSQNEIIRIAEDKVEQLKFIDRFFNFRTYRNRIDSIENKLGRLDSQFKESILAVGNLAALEKQISTCEVKMSQLDEQLEHSIFAEFQIAEQKDETICAQTEYMTTMQSTLREAHEAIATVDEIEPPETLKDDATVRENNELIVRARDSLLSQFETMMRQAASFDLQVKNLQRKWTEEFGRMRSVYNDHVQSEGGDYQQFASQRSKIVTQLEKLRMQHQQAKAKSIQLTTILDKRSSELDELELVYGEYRAAREERCSHFQQTSSGRLRLQIRGASNSDAFREHLLNLKRGSRLLDTYIDTIVENVTPRQFVDLLLKYIVELDSSPIEADRALAQLARKTELGKDVVQRLAIFLAENDKIEDLLRLQYKAHLEDRPNIRYNVGTNKYAPLDSLSVGQKSTALLIMALSDEEMPVVIDQPEDSLDIRSIWDDICSQVRQNKTHRQFIFTTHNSNIAVASDSDKYIVLNADSEHGWIVHTGSMDHNPVDDAVLVHMEGGTDPYRKKHGKYRAGERLTILSD